MMRRADRLFQIVQYLRVRRCTTAEWLAQRLEVSTRTIYRDMQDLSLSGLPLEGEAGSGYRLRHTLDLPPLSFTTEELQALVLGLRLSRASSDAVLAQAAHAALAKIQAVLPQPRWGELQSRLFVPEIPRAGTDQLAPLRLALHEQRKLCLNYQRADGQNSQRVIWPLGLFYWGKVWTLVAWCEHRQSYRQFRLDRMQQVQVLPEPFQESEHISLAAYFRQVESEENIRLPEDWQPAPSPPQPEPMNTPSHRSATRRKPPSF